MKVLALVIFAVASVSSSGSGPYLPSGWRPQGPAFYLPSEVQKPAENLKDAILNESEASGSDALREYGPPKVVEISQDLIHQDLIHQDLPDAVTEQAFAVIEAKFTEVDGEVKEVSEVRAIEEVKEVTEAENAVEVTTEQEATEAVTEAIEVTTEAVQSVPQGRAIDVQAIEETVEVQDATTEKVEVTTAEVAEIKVEVTTTEDAVVKAIPETVVDSNFESTQVEQVSQIQEVSQAEVKTVEGVQNVVEALTNLEQEIKAQQIQSNEEAVDVKSVQILGSVEQAPEGFLEYGPPGFREYGPPQADELVRSGAVVQEPSEEEQKVENNETRRRRFSPKFRPSKIH